MHTPHRRRLDAIARALNSSPACIPTVTRIEFVMPDNGRSDRDLGPVEVRPNVFVVTVPPRRVEDRLATLYP